MARAFLLFVVSAAEVSLTGNADVPDLTAASFLA
jgi:hypothetical protein